jgi:hypothetical protein
MQTEGIGCCKVSKYPAVNQTRNLACCSAVPQPTVLFITFEKCTKQNYKNGTLQLSHCEYTSYWWKKTVSCVAVQRQAQYQRGHLRKFKLFIHAYGKGDWMGWHVWKLKTNSRCRKCKEAAQVTCVTNPMYHSYSRMSSAWIPLIRKKVDNREFQVHLMCSVLFPIFVGAPFLYHGGAMAKYSIRYPSF